MSDESAKVEFLALNEAYLATRPEPGSKHVPEWIKETHGTMPDLPYATVKKCPGVFDAVSMGYVARSPCDIQIRSSIERKEMVYLAAHGRNEDFVSTHQLPSFTDRYPFLDEFWPMALKVDTKYLMRVPDGYSVAFVPLYHTAQFRYFSAAFGVADTFGMEQPRQLLINLFVRRFEGEYLIRRGDPLCRLLPFRAESFTHEVRAATDEEIRRYETFQETMSLEFQHNSLRTHRHRKQFA